MHRAEFGEAKLQPRRRRGRHLHVSSTLDGWVTGDFYLDPVAGANLLSGLDHIGPPDPEDAPDGPRPLSQRRADALADLAVWYLSGDKPGGNPPNVNATIDVASLLGETPEMATVRCDIDGIGPVTHTVIDQLCCDARFARFIMAGPSQILDMGRATRLATPAQRKAITVRDRHCRFPSCDHRPPQQSLAKPNSNLAEGEATTSQDRSRAEFGEAKLKPRRRRGHHTLVHNTKWTITRTPDGRFKFNHPARAP